MWLEDYLTMYPGAMSKDAKEAARKDRISERSLQRAANTLKVVVGNKSSTGHPRQTTWTLPDDSQASRATAATHVSESGAIGAIGATGSDKGKRDVLETQSGQSRQSRHAESNGAIGGATVSNDPRCPFCGKKLPTPEAVARGDCGHPVCVANHLVNAQQGEN